MYADETQAYGGGSVADGIARALAERIVTGALAPGAPVRQDHVAAEFGTSHVPVREAFRKLEGQGLLVAAPRRGVRVAPIDSAAVFETVEMRAALEVLALRHAFPRRTDRDLGAARAALVTAEASASIAVWEQANRRFHRAIVAPCGMQRLLAAIDDLHRASARHLFVTWRNLDWQPRSDAEHEAILGHLGAGEIDAAATLLHRHIVDAGHALVAQLRDGGS